MCAETERLARELVRHDEAIIDAMRRRDYARVALLMVEREQVREERSEALRNKYAFARFFHKQMRPGPWRRAS
jgi:hypothetical protein